MKKATVTLKNIASNDTMVLYVGNYQKCLSFKDELADNHITILNDGISIQRVSPSYRSDLLLKRDHGQCLIQTSEGELEIKVSIKEYQRDDNLIRVVYDTGELIEFKIEIDGSIR